MAVAAESAALAPEPGAEKATATPGIATPSASRTRTARDWENAAATVALCGLPESAWIDCPPSFVSVKTAGVATPTTVAFTV